MATTTAEASGIEKEHIAQEAVDYKMVTFSLGGKDYGIDIMRVKEIAKFHQFTYVPNTAPFVRGVYNLRGDIISIIDLRLMFNLPAVQRKDNEPENGLILRYEGGLLGVIVDSIDKVVGFSRRSIQPPHPIFGDINIKYINGVVEHDKRLYIILDAERIFKKEVADTDGRAVVQDARGSVSESGTRKRATVKSVASDAPVRTNEERVPSYDSVEAGFVAEGLSAFQSFYLSDVNRAWFERRLDEWRAEKKGKNIQLQDAAEAVRFLQPFFSSGNNVFWAPEYAEEVVGAVAQNGGGNLLHVWNPGTGGGHEAYSLACALRRAGIRKQFKIWAGDNDLLKISAAPNLTFSLAELPEAWHEYVVETGQGCSFAPAIKDSILFEFSDALHSAGLPKMDLIVARDLVSFHSPVEQRRLFDLFGDTLKNGGVLILGRNEQAPADSGWIVKEGRNVRAYIKR